MRIKGMIFLFALAVAPPASAAPKDAADGFFRRDKVHDVRLRISPHGWALMEPTRRARPATLIADNIPAPATRPAGRAPDPKRDGERAEEPKLAKVEGEKLPPNNFGFEYVYVKAAFTCDGQTLPDVGIRFKGNSSFENFQRSTRRAFKLDFDRFVDKQTFRGLSTLNLNNNAFDRSLMREALSFEVYRLAGVPAPRTAFANVYLTVDGQYQDHYLGVYTFIEEVDTSPFLKRAFGSAKGVLLKPEGTRGLPYMGEAWEPYADQYRSKTSPDPKWTARFIEFVKLVNYADDAAFAKQIGDYLHVDQFLRYLAATVLITSLDSPLVTHHNYFLYLSPSDGKVRYLPWDMNLSFATYGTQGFHSQVNLSIDRPWGGSQKIFDRLLAIPEHKAAYRAHLRRFVETFFNEPATGRLIDEIERALRDTEEARTGGGGNVTGSGWDVAARIPLRTYVARRVESVLAQLEGLDVNAFVPRANPGHAGFPWGLNAPREYGNLTAMAAAVRRAADTDGTYKLTGRELRDAVAALYFQMVDESHTEYLTFDELADGLDPIARAHGAHVGSRGFLGFGGDPEAGVSWARFVFRALGARADAKVTLADLTQLADQMFCLADRDQNGRLDEREIAEGLDLLIVPDGGEAQNRRGRR